MPLLGNGVLTIWNGIDPALEDEFLKWHVHEHIPERVALPGFLRARRYVAMDGAPKFFNFYETASIADLESSVYQQALNTPSDWTRQVVRHFTQTSRTSCRTAATRGQGEGAVIETLRMTTHLSAPEITRRLIEVLGTASCESGVVGVHLLEGISKRGTLRETAEMRLRGGPEETEDWVLLVDAVRADIIEQLRRTSLSTTSLVETGVEPEIKRGLYALQFSLTKPEIENNPRVNDWPRVSHPSISP